MSAELRRSKHLADKKNKNLSNVSSSSNKESLRSINKMDTAAVEDNTSTRKTAKSTSSRASRTGCEQLQKRHEQLQKQYELMDLKLALKLVEFQGENDGISDRSSEIRVESGSVNESCGPDVNKWVKGDTPWGLADKQQDHNSNKSVEQNLPVTKSNSIKKGSSSSLNRSFSSCENSISPVFTPRLAKLRWRHFRLAEIYLSIYKFQQLMWLLK
ncbi:hypothetical protein HHI36_018462 [Cryptolaemus montrouzieri]|uniref:Uncharacterized protein n=1 Tax=Cryptolaemus montrouzieri TaxID=559131 RepID=A0ABD2P0P4_9CUCU